MRYNYFFLISVSLFLSFSSILKAGAWVKESGKYYTKFSLSQSSERLYNSETSSENYLQKDQTWALYGEFGLPLAFPLQMSAYIPYKSIERNTPDKSENFVSKGLGDTTLSLKYLLLEPSSFLETPANFLLALSLGTTLPSTATENRYKNEEKRHGELSSENHHLISGIDRGKVLFSLAIESSVYWKALWFSLSEKILGSGSGTASRETIMDLGLGLPSNSWVQISWSQLISRDQNLWNTITTKTGASLGWTAISNIALELGYFMIKSSDKAWEDHNELSLGLSIRTL